MRDDGHLDRHDESGTLRPAHELKKPEVKFGLVVGLETETYLIKTRTGKLAKVAWLQEVAARIEARPSLGKALLYAAEKVDGLPFEEQGLAARERHMRKSRTRARKLRHLLAPVALFRVAKHGPAISMSQVGV
jgi:hypothetical protein